MAKASIKRNRYDNWYGYVGGKRVIAFCNDGEGTQEKHAMEWLEQQQITDVIFRVFIDTGDVIALFPAIAGTNDIGTCQSFMHIGQHSSASIDLRLSTGWQNQGNGVTRIATPSEYASLKRELESEPYKYKLRIVRRFTQIHQRARQAQIRGE